MTDLELLEMYEPALRFAKSERFFPMAVEPYLENCALIPYAPEAALERLQMQDGHPPLAAQLGKLKSEKFFLRFVNQSFDNSVAWRGLLAFSLMGLAIGGFFWGWTGIEADLAFSFLVALFLFMLHSPVRLRIIPSVLAALLFCAVSFAPLLFFLRLSEKMDAAIGYMIVFPIYGMALFYALMLTLKFTIEQIVPEGPGMIMDMFSRATEKVAEQAYVQYAEILKSESQPVYYGRVLREEDREGNRWTILQYHFFYAFNEWRFAANGMNHHEGDWELVAVYLKNDSPYAVLFSRHGAGGAERWENTLKVKDQQGASTMHPLVYVALGSHANYSRVGEVESASLYQSEKMQRFLVRLDAVIRFLFLWLNPDQRHIVVDAFRKEHEHVFDEEALAKIRYGEKGDQYIVRLPFEIVSGDGLRVGPHEQYLAEPQMQSSRLLKWHKTRRITTRPASSVWRRILLNSDCDWVQYKGLWGVKSWLNEESGPPGPRWERLQKNQTGAQERVRWGAPLQWLQELETNKH